MRKCLKYSLIFFAIALFIFTIKMAVVFAGTEEELSAQSSNQKPEYIMLYQIPFMYRNGDVVQVKLIKITKEVCTVTQNGDTGCVDGWTEQKSDNTRKIDPEHPVDTTETIYLRAVPGKVLKVSKESLQHELFHANDYHWHSRSVCETNWRYIECLENSAYNYVHLLKQMEQIKKIKLI